MYYTIILSIILVAIYYLFVIKREFIPIPQLISIPIVIIIILIMRFSYTESQTLSYEYRGSLGVNAIYTEYWETWINKTCSREVCIQRDKNGNCTNYKTEYYDCSYCDENPPTWYIYDNVGGAVSIDNEYFKKLQRQWHSKLEFINKKRNIKRHLGCGVDGNAYKIIWDNKIHTSESIIHSKSYNNKVKVSNSTFNYKKISQKDVKKYNLYEYPEIYNFHYKQKPIQGLDKLNIPQVNKELIDKYYQYLNGNGEKTKGMVYVLLFPNKDINISSLQEQYWYGGNRNEVVICIGYEPNTLKLDWVKVFSWTKDKMVHVELREELMEIGTLDLLKMYKPIEKVMNTYYKPRDLKEFEYLDIVYPQWMYIVSLILSITLPIISFFIRFKNI